MLDFFSQAEQLYSHWSSLLWTSIGTQVPLPRISSGTHIYHPLLKCWKNGWIPVQLLLCSIFCKSYIRSKMEYLGWCYPILTSQPWQFKSIYIALRAINNFQPYCLFPTDEMSQAYYYSVTISMTSIQMSYIFSSTSSDIYTGLNNPHFLYIPL